MQWTEINTQWNISIIHIIFLQYFDGSSRSWYDSLGFPDKHRAYVFEIVCKDWKDKSQTKLTFEIILLKKKYMLNAYDLAVYTFTPKEFNPRDMVLVTPRMVEVYKGISEI